MNRQATTIYLLTFIIILLVLIQLYIQSDLAMENGEYAILSKDLQEEQSKNMLIYEEILRAEALMTIADEASKEGFVDVGYEYLK